MENIKKAINFLFELAGAKTTPRTGWQRIGIKLPESMADHCALSGQIAYILAAMEGANGDRAAALALFHAVTDLRTGEQNLVSRSYSSRGSFKEEALDDQLASLACALALKTLFEEIKERQTKESLVAADADLLDMAIQAKIYAENGNKKALLWMESIKNDFATESAKQIFNQLGNSGIEDWWMELESIKKKFGNK